VEKLAKLRAAGIASPYLSLPNIMSGVELYPEMIGSPVTDIAGAALRLLAGDLSALHSSLAEVRNSLNWDDAGQVISDEVAQVIGE
jgi:lipid A disaccharide synthetase